MPIRLSKPDIHDGLTVHAVKRIFHAKTSMGTITTNEYIATIYSRKNYPRKIAFGPDHPALTKRELKRILQLMEMV